MVNLMTASNQWANRPDDERFLSLADLRDAVQARRLRSEERGVAFQHLEVNTLGNDIVLQDGFEDTRLTHWSFSQLARMAKAPAGYLRSLPAQLAVIPLSWSMDQNNYGDGKVLLDSPDATVATERTARALTSSKYGRIWDIDVVKALDVLDPDVWKVPAASYTSSDPKRATTLYASDRDVFIFLVNEDNAIEVPGTNGEDRLYRGFFAWNSETGSKTFGLTTFMYRYVCDNRIVWGAEEVSELRIRHSSGAPHRFMREAQPFLENYLQAGTTQVVEQIEKAKEKEVAQSEDGVVKWLRGKGFTQGLATVAARKARQDDGNPRSVWNLVQALTSQAQQTQHTDERVAIESKAGKLMATVS